MRFTHWQKCVAAGATLSLTVLSVPVLSAEPSCTPESQTARFHWGTNNGYQAAPLFHDTRPEHRLGAASYAELWGGDGHQSYQSPRLFVPSQSGQEFGDGIGSEFAESWADSGLESQKRLFEPEEPEDRLGTLSADPFAGAVSVELIVVVPEFAPEFAQEYAAADETDTPPGDEWDQYAGEFFNSLFGTSDPLLPLGDED